MASVLLLVSACANRIPKMEHPEEVRVQGDFDRMVTVQDDVKPQTSPVTVSETPLKSGAVKDAAEAPKKRGNLHAKQRRKKSVAAGALDATKAPSTEAPVSAAATSGANSAGAASASGNGDAEKEFSMQPELREHGLSASPFRVGEKVFHKVRYFNVNAGSLELDVRPFVNVNGRKAYRFVTAIKSSSLFSNFYSVDDSVQTDVDFESLLPMTFVLNIQESGQIKEGKSFFNHKTMKANYWESKFTEKDGKQEKSQEWELGPFAQNVFSAAFYVRNFAWAVGDERFFTVADDEKNLTFKAVAVRKEHLSTDAGEFDAIVLKPTIILKDKFQPMGETNIWLSDDDRHYVLKIACQIKIGTLVSEISKLVPGNP